MERIKLDLENQVAKERDDQQKAMAILEDQRDKHEQKYSVRFFLDGELTVNGVHHSL